MHDMTTILTDTITDVEAGASYGGDARLKLFASDGSIILLPMPAHVAAAMADAFAKATAEGDRIAAVVDHARAVA
jgi:hypothetical protein